MSHINEECYLFFVFPCPAEQRLRDRKRRYLQWAAGQEF